MTVNNEDTPRFLSTSITIRIIHSLKAAVVDSGTAGQYLTEDLACLKNNKLVFLLPVKKPNREITSSTNQALLPNTALTRKERETHIFPCLKNIASLVSIGNFCNNGCISIFDNNFVYILSRLTHEVIMKGGRNINSGLYVLELANKAKNTMIETKIPDTLFANNIYECKSKFNLVKYPHQVC